MFLKVVVYLSNFDTHSFYYHDLITYVLLENTYHGQIFSNAKNVCTNFCNICIRNGILSKKIIKRKKIKIAKLIQEGNTGNTFSVFHLKDNNINN